MNKKIFLPLIAVAALGASCTNEVDEFAQQSANGKGFKVNLQVANSEANTRILWDGVNDPTWENVDQFSVFNTKPTVGESDGRLTAFANAAYKTVDGGKNFTSENVLYVGKHVLCYPLNKDFYTEKVLTVAPGTDGDKGLGANSVFLNKTPLNVTAEGSVTADGITYNDAGYQKNIRVSVRPVNAGVFFNLKEAGNFTLGEDDAPVQINKVEFIHEGASPAPFSTHAVVAEQSGKIVTLSNGNTQTAYTEYKTNMPVLTSEGTITPIAILPNEAYVGDAASTSKILVYTNYGVVTIEKAGMVTKTEGEKVKVQLAAGLTEKTDDNAKQNLSFNSIFVSLANIAKEATASGSIKRDVVVDMTTANIDGLEIKNSAQLKTAYRAFDLMGKNTGDVTFKLIPDADGKFELTKEAVEIINNHKKNDAYATLITAGITEFTLSGYGNDAYNTVPAIDQIDGDILVLAADSKWKLDVNSAAAVNMYTEIKNMGELQLTQGAGTTYVIAKITNNNKVVFDGTETIVPIYMQNNGTIAVAKGQTVKLTSAEFTNGSTTNVKGELISTNYVAIEKGATVNVWGNLLNTKGCFLTNAGTINVLKETAQVILSANAFGTDLGTVNVTAKDNNLNTGSAKGYVKLEVDATEFALNAENMGVANYVEFSGSVLAIETETYGYFVEMQANAKVTSEDKLVSAFIVNNGVEVTIADGSIVTCGDVINDGKIYNYGKFKFPATVTNKGTIYDL